MYLAKTKSEVISQNTVLEATDFGGWQCVNAGTTTCTVNGIPLVPGGQVVGVDFTTLRPDVIWSEPIRITFTGTGTNKLLVTRIKYTYRD